MTRYRKPATPGSRYSTPAGELRLRAELDELWRVLRPQVTRAVQEAAGFFADGRMNAEVIRVLASGRPCADHLYAKTLFPAREAFQGSCTAKSTIYTANIAAGLMVGQFARWLRGWPVVPDQMLNLVAAEYHVIESTI